MKELIAVVFACREFNYSIYRRYVTVETDPQPLITILKKTLQVAPSRLPKKNVEIQNCYINVVYKRGKEFYIADPLSRAFFQHKIDSQSCDGNAEEHEVMYVLQESYIVGFYSEIGQRTPEVYHDSTSHSVINSPHCSIRAEN